MTQIKKIGPIWFLALLIIFANSIYWLFLASDRYVSEANVVLESPEVSMDSLNMAAMLSNNNSSSDLLLLRDHILSVDMMLKLENKLGIKKYYSNDEYDFFSRLRNENSPVEIFHRYYLSRVSAEVDDYAGVLRIKVQAFTPDMAQRIANSILLYGEKHMNDMGQKLAMEQVEFIEEQVELLSVRLSESRQKVLDYQNDHGLVSPTGTVESISAVIATLEAELAQLTTQLNVLRNFQSKNSPEVVKINSQINAVKLQIESEKSRMADRDGNALNEISSEYEALLLQSQFALDLYSSSLSALENTRVEAIRKLKQISILQMPTMPEYSVEPRRLYWVFLVFLITLMASTIAKMVSFIIKDHRD